MESDMKTFLSIVLVALTAFSVADPSFRAKEKDEKAMRASAAMYNPDTDSDKVAGAMVATTSNAGASLGTDLACAAVGAGTVGGLWYGEDHFGHEDHKKPAATPEIAGWAVLAIGVSLLQRRRKLVH